MTIEPFHLPDPGGNGSTKFPGYEMPEQSVGLITGPNGGGKTTTLNFLHRNPGLLRNHGTISVALLDQIYERLLYPYKPVWWNLALPRIISHRLDAKAARRLAQEKLGLFDLDLDPDRYAVDLSGGETHLVLCLRMSLCSQTVILLDEPATAVDASRVGLLWKMVRYLVRDSGKTVILSTHRDVPPWARKNPLTFPGIRGRNLCFETLIPSEEMQT